MDQAEEIRAILDIVREHVEARTGVKTLLEPQPVKLFEPHVRIMAPTGWDFQYESTMLDDVAQAMTVQLDALATLTAYGSGPDVYLDQVVSASYRLNRYFHDPISIRLADLSHGYWKARGAGNISVTAKRRPGGQHFRNEDQEDKSKPYLYEEIYEVSIFFPYGELI